jgi:hypothetical protein
MSHTNKIYFISARAFGGLVNLKGLYLGDNKLKIILAGTFVNKQLRRIGAVNNGISYIEHGAFNKGMKTSFGGNRCNSYQKFLNETCDIGLRSKDFVEIIKRREDDNSKRKFDTH